MKLNCGHLNIRETRDEEVFINSVLELNSGDKAGRTP